MARESATPQSEDFAEQMTVAKAELALTLSIAQQQVENELPAAVVIDRLATQLHLTRRKFSPQVWQALVEVAQNHPVSDFFLEDPFTRWSFEKPRGYSGDAHLLDFIYGHARVSEAIERASPRGRALYDYTREAPSSVAVRERRDLLTRHIDEIAIGRGPDTEILTIAAGHLREAERSTALQSRMIKRWVALDQDPESIGSIAKDFAGTCVEAIDGSVRGLLTGRHSLGQFDFIYAAGLYDYLSFGVAVKLTERCLQMLKPGGVFLFANFSNDVAVDGYMETFMNWALLLRSESDMWDIIAAVDGREAFDASVHFGANRNIVYGIVRSPS
ncbi:methyltransferase [Rhizobium tubonense]|uniref:Methyltransferase n=2 Tax=Rhizobium tubonense TaxID=484088 RepID=A0A2W4CTM6_9HYPH|nr:class I SAM-dependent methyltransferase [Rhizobium tubonense]PZM08764.1 methyltransferase [Rhizobium tubonense]